MTDLSGEGVRILILATATHTGSALPSLPTVPETFDDLREAFVDRCGARAENVVGVLDPSDARTMAAVIAEEAARAQSILVVYFIGHGLRGPGGELFLAAADTGELIPGLAAHQALSFAALAQAVQGCRAAAVVVILDCCFSGTATLDADTASIREFATGAHGRYLIGSAEHLASAPAGQRHTAFTGALLELLEHGDAREPAWLTLDSVFDGIYRRLRHAQQGPLPRRQAGDRAGEVIIAPNPASAPRPQVARDPVPGRCPYPGLAAFGPEDAGMFFGRGPMLERLLEALAGARAEGGVQVLVGASGSGKTSLLNAGLVAALRDRGLPGITGSAGWPVRRFTPGADPLQRLAAALDAPDARGSIDTEPSRVGEYAEAILAGRDGDALVVIVDQLEELFTLCTDLSARTTFLAALTALAAPRTAAGPQALVATALRADFYGHAATYPELVAALRDRQILIEPMTRPELREAIEKPANANGWTLADGLAEIILNDLEPDTTTATGALPLLSHAMLSTWNRREDRELTVAGYRATGGIANAIKHSADTIYTSASDADRGALRMMLPRLVRVSADGDADTIQPVDRTALTRGVTDPDIAEQVLDQLTEARLITMDRDTVRLAHEALLREWPRLREWIDTDRDWLHRSQRFITDSHHWQHSGTDGALLYRGSQLAAIRDRGIPADQDPILADPVSTAFLTAAIRGETRRTLQRRAVTAILLVLVVALAAVAVVAVRAGRESNHQRDIAIARELASRSEQFASTDPVWSRLAALAAWRTQPIPEARYAMLAAARNPLRAVLPAPTGGGISVAFSPDGHTLAAYSSDMVQLWDISTGRQIGEPFASDSGAVSSAAFSPNGQILATSGLATGGHDGMVRLWDTRTHQQIGEPLIGHTDVVLSVVFSPDGRTIATAGSADGTTRLWDTRTHRQIGEPLVSNTNFVGSVVFSPDGQTLAASSNDGTAQLWDTRTQRQIGEPFTGEGGGTNSVAFSPDESILAASGGDGTARLWDIRTHQQIGDPPTGEGGGRNSVAFGPDGHTLVTSSRDGMVRLWDTCTGRPIGEPLTGHTSVSSVVLSRDGSTLATSSYDNTVRLWDTGTGRPIGEALTGHTGAVLSVAFSPDGHTLATGTAKGPVQLWDTRTRQQIGAPLTGHTQWVNSVVFSPDGHTLATASYDDTVRLWDTRTRQQIGEPLTGEHGGDNSIAFSPDGHTLATVSDIGGAWLLDTRTRQQIGAPLTSRDNIVNSVAFSPDGHTLATHSRGDDTVRLWDTRTRQQIGELHIGRAELMDLVVFSPDWHTLATSGSDGTVRLWDTRTRQQIGESLTSDQAPPSVVFSPDGRTLAISGEHTAQLGDIGTGRPIGEFLTGDTASVLSVAFSPDRRNLATGSGDSDGTVRLWDVGFSGDVAASLCSQVGGVPAQPARDLPEIPTPQQLCPHTDK
ncbi:caspase, EACC1-associated type [Nocardia miyunensis]|uniref:caspase, EACC1-associated type n=1 Tax=Nocardia miyunensis TaxID=282684 RepID=UPI000831EE05|nr:AAA family ATPase [Nocardia miyunensis]